MGWKDRLKRSLTGDEAAPAVAVPSTGGAEAAAEAEALRTAPSPAGDPVYDDLLAKVVELSEGELTADAIDPAGHLLDLGYIHSLSAVTFIAHIEDRYGVHVEDIELVGNLSSLEAIADHVRRSRGAA